MQACGLPVFPLPLERGSIQTEVFMKQRPRRVENQIADALNKQFPARCTTVERIPVLGREGPDISINELNLVVDVKSRIEVPETIFFPLTVPFEFDGLTAVRIANMQSLWSGDKAAPLDFSSKLVRGYIDHMDKWTKEHCPDGISCVVLHRPKMPIGSAVVIIYSSDRRRLTNYAERIINSSK